MRRRRSSPSDNNGVSISALDIFANAVGALAFILLLFAAYSIELARPSTLRVITQRVPVSHPGTDYLAVMAAVGGVAPYSWSLTDGSLPEGLRLDATLGEIVGSPGSLTAGGSFPFEVTVADTRNRSARARFELRVLPVKKSESFERDPLVLLTHGELPEAFADQPYSLFLAARGGSGRYRWMAEGLPADLSVAGSSGLLTGLPKLPGVYELVLRVSDEREGSGDAGLAVAAARLQVVGSEDRRQDLNSLSKPVILTDRIPPAVESESYQVTFAGTGLGQLRWSAENLPAGWHLGQGGVLSGKSETAMTANFRVSFEDSRKIKAAEKTIQLKVNPRPLTFREQVTKVGLARWLGYLIIVLSEIGFLSLLNLRSARDLGILLKLHRVDYIRRADGTEGLSGAPENTKAVERQAAQTRRQYHRYRMISYAVLMAVLAGYTIYLFT